MSDGVDQAARDSVIDVRRTIGEIVRDFVRKEVYDAQRAADSARISEVEKDNIALEAKVDKAEERRAADRRLIMASLLLPIIVGIIFLYLQSQVGR